MLARGLHLVRRLRNDFAHNVTGCTFQDSVVAGRLTELRRVSGLPEHGRDFRDKFPEGARGDFQMIVGWYQWNLRSLAEDVPRLSQERGTAGYFDADDSSEGKGNDGGGETDKK